MAKQVRGAVVVLTLLLGLAGTVAWAQPGYHPQVPGDVRATFDVPFDFVVADKVLHAGQYDVRLVGSPVRLVMIQSAETRGGEFVQIDSPLNDAGVLEPQAIFDDVNGRHYLYQIRVPGAQGAALPGVPGELTRAEFEQLL